MLGLVPTITVASIEKPLAVWADTVRQSLLDESLSGLARALSDMATWHQGLGATEQEAVVSAARAFINEEARELLDMSGDEFVKCLESGDMPAPSDETGKARLTVLAIVAPLVRLGVAA
ncbi:MAG: hypothetical protein IT306_18865 [Chloroflexi bacterium]|nr:hypothetical protein [Chloroflexota bacterium]